MRGLRMWLWVTALAKIGSQTSQQRLNSHSFVHCLGVRQWYGVLRGLLTHRHVILCFSTAVCQNVLMPKLTYLQSFAAIILGCARRTRA